MTNSSANETGHNSIGVDEAAKRESATDDSLDPAVTAALAVGAAAAGAALFEAALLPGLALGVAAMLAPKFVPKVGAAVTPVFRSSVRGIYKFGQKTNEMMAEAKEQVQDIVAEVKAEDEVKADEKVKSASPQPAGAAASA